VILTVRGLTLDGSMQGLAYYLDPDWSQLARPATWRYAFGQVFFSLSLAFGVMVTYASFLHRKSDINNNAAIISIADFATSFIAGLAVFATLGGMAYATQAAGHPVPVEKVAETGPSLAFVAFPYALAQLPYSAWFSFIFFFALITLGIDSAFSITESILASIVDKTGWRRSIVLPAMSVVGLLFGLFYVTRGGLNWLGTIDGFVNGTWGIAFLGLLECVVLAWLWRVEVLRRHANERSDWSLGRWWDWLLRFVIPVVLGTLFFWQLFDDIGKADGFLIRPDGSPIVSNCVGMTVMVIAPVLAVILSLAKGRSDMPAIAPRQHLPIQGRAAGFVVFVFSILPAVLIAAVHLIGFAAPAGDLALWFLPTAGLLCIFASNYIVNKYNTADTSASWFARWAGIIAAMDLAAFIATKLAALSRAIEGSGKEAQEVITHELTGVSYVILAVVFLIIIGGLGWCFWRALTAAERTKNGNGK